MRTITVRPQPSNADFELVTRCLVGQGGLPISRVLQAEVIEAIFRRHDALFGDTYNAIYTTAIVLWAFLSQVLADGKLRSCATAVARIADFLMTVGKTPPSPDTGAYCVARQKLHENALHELLAEMARKMEYVAPEPWLWHGRHAKLADGFTETCATLLAAWSTLALGLYDAAAIASLLACIALLEIPDRPGRIEPRVLKRRRHRNPLMHKPRQTLRDRLKSRTRCATIP